MSLLELGWRVGLYFERESRNPMTLSGLKGAETVNSTRLTHLFWPIIGDGGYNVGNTKAKSIRNSRIKLAHRCITMTISGRKETTNRVTEIILFYLYCIFEEGVVCNIPYWLAKYLKSVRDKGWIFRGMFVTKIAWSFGLLTEEMVVVLNRKPPPDVYRKTSLVKMGVIMELHEGECCWTATRGVVEEDKGDGEEGPKSAMDGPTRRPLGRLNTWMEQQDQRAHWMYDHTVRQFQYMSTRDNLKLDLQIDPFLGFEFDYPLYGYHLHMPLGYTYRPNPSQDGSS
nr:hypothetical protein [Tanacetum cinerariifolium]